MNAIRTAIPACALLLAGALAAQASFTTFGAPCGLPTGSAPPGIANAGLPRLGQTFTILYKGPNAFDPGIQLSDWPTLFVGASRIDLPIPPITASQPAGCVLYPSPDVVVPMPLDPTGTSFQTSFAVAVPNDPGLLGATLWAQWLTPHHQCYFVGCGFGWVLASQGAKIVVGP